MKIDLLPCPFCGHRADEYEGMYGNGIYCMRCGVMMGGPIHKEFRIAKRVSYEEAAEAWNTRAERTCRMLPGRPYYDMGEEGYTCSECGSWAKLDWVAHYCPNCGAKVVE